MSVTLRVILIISSFIAFYLCITKIKKSQLKIENSVTWMLGCIILILMSIFPNVVVWISEKLGFVAPVNFIFFVQYIEYDYYNPLNLLFHKLLDDSLSIF